MNKNQWQKFPATFANNYTIKESYNNKNMIFKSESETGQSELAACPSPPTPTSEDLRSAAAQIAQAMKIESCKTSSFNAQGEIDALGGLAGSASFNISGSSTMGCDQIMAMANSYYQSQQNISCILKQSTTSDQTVVTGINSININVGGNLIQGCDFVIDQNLKLTLIKTVQLSQNQIEQVSNIAKTNINDIINALQDSKSGFGATPQGSKYISDSKTKIQGVNFNQNVTQTLNEITTSVQGGNTINITAGRSVILKGSQCKISQDSVIDIMATSILNDQISNIFTSMSEMTKKTTTDNTQKSDNQGMPNLFEGKWVKYLMMGIAVIVLFGGISYAASKQDWGEISKNVVAAKTGGGMGKVATGVKK
jgi:hypothetical protein